ncbi:D-cysteine desulfhydrase 1, mitochondrial-like [Tasmannia lanceolata]|uniref:D-cysteine desulfhydrase 1, mitochondrial-like n=1 Tax=Tasmannia lanceolata TaxID=3420 RepID=UPI0040648F91
MADAMSLGADCIITIGAIQSNHCRATAIASKYLNLDCFLILCTSEVNVDKDPGLSGNLLIERLVGAHVELATWEEFEKIGSLALLNLVQERLVKEGRRPYIIPVGGSNSLGTWGYIEAVREIEQQLQQREFGEVSFDDIVAACGSAGTIVGLSLGSWLSTLKAKVHAFAVGGDLDNYYEYAQALLDELQANLRSCDLLHIQDEKGLGYAISTTEELAFIKEVAETTGVILDPVYSGKAAYGFSKDVKKNPAKWAGRKVLFIHTGGIFGLYDKSKQLNDTVGKWNRMEIHDLISPKDSSQFW